MRFRARVGLGYGEFWRGIIFDVEFKHFADIVAQAKRFFNAFNDGAQFKESAQEYKWTWPTGEQLLFRHAKKLSDYDDFHGHEYPFIGWNELTKYATADLYDKMQSTNRSSFVPELHTPKDEKGNYKTADKQPLPPIPLEVFSTTNPNGPGHNWVKRRFIDAAEPGQIVRTKTIVFNPRLKKDVEVVKTQVHIFGSYRENIYLDPKYIASLDAIKDPNLRAAWLLGSWDVTSGGAIDDIWNSDIHVLPKDFKAPKTWRIDRAFDWGSTEPFAVGWFAESNGEEARLPNGEVFCPPAGSLVMIAEWYGTLEIGTNKGLKMSATKVAEGIKEREIAWMKTGLFHSQPKAGPADNQIRNVNDVSVDSTETLMKKQGIHWTESDKSPGSNSVGLQLLRDALEAAVECEGKALYITRNCPASLELLPPMTRDELKPDEVSHNYEKHLFDVIKYRLLAGNNRTVTKINVSFSR